MIEIIESGVFYSSEKFKNVFQTPERTTDCYEIEFYISDEGQSVIDGKEYVHRKGNLLFIRPGQRRFSKRTFVCLFLHLQIDPYTAALLAQIPTFSVALAYNEYVELFQKINKLHEVNKEDSRLLLQSALYQLMDMIAHDSKLDSVTTQQYVKEALAYMESNFRGDIQLEDIAAHVSLSPSYFHKIFKRATNSTPQKYLSELRLNHAKMLLLTKAASIEEISEESGFSSLSYFDYLFKKVYGISPTSFRKQRYIF